MGVANVDLEWSLAPNLCGWDNGTVEYSMDVRLQNSTEIVTQFTTVVSPHQLKLVKGNYTVELTAINNCGETSEPESFPVFIDCGDVTHNKG